MATTTVKVLAKELKRTAADLLEQLRAAGIDKSSEDESITEKDKTALLEHLRHLLAVEPVFFACLENPADHEVFDPFASD